MSGAQTQRYFVASERSLEELINTTNNRLALGWRCEGGLVISIFATTPIFLQTLIMEVTPSQ